MGKNAKATGTAVAEVKGGAALPAHLAQYKGPDGRGNLDSSDVVVPRLKLLQALSPEVSSGDFDDAKAGNFWHNILDASLGSEFSFVPLKSRKHFILFDPDRSNGTKILARAPDAINWSPADAEFPVKIKGLKAPVTWKTAKTVAESGLDQFGSSNPNDEDSPPAATLIYEYLVWLPDFPEYSPVLLSGARSQVPVFKRELNAKLALVPGPMHGRIFKAKSIKVPGPEGGDYYNFSFRGDGIVEDPEDFAKLTELVNRFKDYKVADEEGLADEGDTVGNSEAVAEKVNAKAKNSRFA